jgi:phosphatidate phosphatase PAH1
MLEERDIEGVENWTLNTQKLEKELESTREKLHFSRTLAERQKLFQLEAEISRDRKRVAELRSLAYETSCRNKPDIERLKLETARLINQSIEIDNESVILELSLRPKQQELTDLRRQIEAGKNSV